jgi:hypothetical protein
MSLEGIVEQKTLSHRRQMLLSNRRKKLLSNRTQRLSQSLTLSPKPIPSITHLIREDPRLLVTASSAIMVVVHSTKVSALYPWVIISSLWQNHLRDGVHRLGSSWVILDEARTQSTHIIIQYHILSLSKFITLHILSIQKVWGQKIIQSLRKRKSLSFSTFSLP